MQPPRIHQQQDILDSRPTVLHVDAWLDGAIVQHNKQTKVQQLINGLQRTTPRLVLHRLLLSFFFTTRSLGPLPMSLTTWCVFTRGTLYHLTIPCQHTAQATAAAFQLPSVTD